MNWAIAIARDDDEHDQDARRRRKRSRVLVERETWETAGDMEAKLPTAAPPGRDSGDTGLPVLELGAVARAARCAARAGLGDRALGADRDRRQPAGTGRTTSSYAPPLALAQLAQEPSFLLVPFAIAASKGATLAEAIAPPRPAARSAPLDALKWMGAAIGIYLVFVDRLRRRSIGEPEQEDFADDLGPLPVQILLIAIAAPIGEEVCFRGMLFGGLRERLPMWAAALISGAIFGLLHVTTGHLGRAAADRLRLPARAASTRGPARSCPASCSTC